MGWSGLERGVRCVVVGHAAAPRLRCHFHRRICVCTGNSISDAGVTALAEALKTNNTVQRVDLRGMSCVCSWCCVVLEAAPLRAHLFWTVDGGSGHGPRGFAGGAGRGVGRMPEGPSGSRGGGSVGRLLLSWSGLQRGVRCVVVGHAAAPHLRCHFHRRICVCTANDISDAGATALAEALKTNNTVQSVYLGGMSCVCSWCCVVLEAAPLRAHLFWTVDGGSGHGPRGFAGGAGRGVGRMPEGPSGSRGGGSVGRLQLRCVSHVC